MIAHCSMIRAANAAKERLVTGRSGNIHVGKLLRGLANELNERGRDCLCVTLMLVLGALGRTVVRDERCDRGKAAQHYQTQDRPLAFGDSSRNFRDGFMV